MNGRKTDHLARSKAQGPLYKGACAGEAGAIALLLLHQAERGLGYTSNPWMLPALQCGW